jgi:DNA-binding HxlR family transcriptional regulator
MVNSVIRDSSHTITRMEMDQLFDFDLRPMRSKNARLIFKLFFEANKQEITTLDMQEFLKKYENPLSKKELNNWLKVLQDAKLIEKAENRGKPTTIAYSGKYSFDLYRLTERGREIFHKISIFLSKYPILDEYKTLEKAMITPQKTQILNDFENIKNQYIGMAIIRELKNEMSSDILSERTGIRHENLMEYFNETVRSETTPLYQIHEIPLGIGKKILSIIGFKAKKTYVVSLSPEGKKNSGNQEKP